MQRVSGGYTIIEVIIFLAVSTALFAAAVNMLGGKQGQVEFDQKARDTQSKIEDWLNDVTTGFTGGDPTQLNCSLDGSNRPVVKTGGPTVNPKCVFLGKAVQFTDNSVNSNLSYQLYTYSIFGDRLDPATMQLPTNLFSANPAPAVGAAAGNGSNVDLTEVLNLNPAYVKSVASQAVSSGYTNSHLVGFFNSFNTEQNTVENGSQNLNIKQFRFDGSSPTPGNSLKGGSTLRDCLELLNSSSCKVIGSPDGWPEPLQKLTVCLTDGKHFAQLIINSNSGFGATTELNYTSC